MPPIYDISLPGYDIKTPPDHEALGKVVDDEIKKLFHDQTIVVRAIGSSEHPGRSIDELVKIIQTSGTDRYDPNRTGDRYENIANKKIDFFAFRRKVTQDMKLFRDVVWGFYHSALEVHGRAVRIDILIVYDASQVEAVNHQYEGRTDTKRDGFVFKDPVDRRRSVKSIIKITG